MERGIIDNKKRLESMTVSINSMVNAKKTKRELFYLTAFLADGRVFEGTFLTRTGAIREVRNIVSLADVLWARVDEEHAARIVRRMNDMPHPVYRAPAPVYMHDPFDYWS